MKNKLLAILLVGMFLLIGVTTSSTSGIKTEVKEKNYDNENKIFNNNPPTLEVLKVDWVIYYPLVGEYDVGVDYKFHDWEDDTCRLWAKCDQDDWSIKAIKCLPPYNTYTTVFSFYEGGTYIIEAKVEECHGDGKFSNIKSLELTLKKCKTKIHDFHPLEKLIQPFPLLAQPLQLTIFEKLIGL